MTKGQEILAAIKDRLSVISNLQIFEEREQNLDANEVPAINLREDGENTIFSPTQRTYITTTKVTVEIVVQGRDLHEAQDTTTDPAITQLREIQEQIESLLLHEWETLGEIIYRLIYTGAQMAAANNGQLTTKARKLSFDAEWHRNVIRYA